MAICTRYGRRYPGPFNCSPEDIIEQNGNSQELLKIAVPSFGTPPPKKNTGMDPKMCWDLTIFEKCYSIVASWSHSRELYTLREEDFLQITLSKDLILG